MTLKYYLRHCLWGLAGFGYLFFMVLKDFYNGVIFPAYIPYVPYALIYIAISAITYPLSFFVSENLAMLIIKKETWNYNFSANGPSWNFFLILYILCGLLSIPLLMLYPFLIKKR